MLDDYTRNDDWNHAAHVLRSGGYEISVDGKTASVTADLGNGNSFFLSCLAPTDHPESLGRIGNLEVKGVIGFGGAGIVYKAIDVSLGRTVAIKMLNPTLADQETARLRFEREARAMASVTHENIVPIHAVAEHQGLPYLVMEYVPGGTLAERIATQGPFDLVSTVRVGLQIASGLSAAHKQGVVHRDVKPSNILLAPGIDRVRVADFGLARVLDDHSHTETGLLVGTPQFMSPEQIRSGVVDARTDQFSLGSLLFNCCTGVAPFHEDNMYSTMQAISNGEAKSAQSVQPNVPDWMDDLIHRLHEKDPADRFQSTEEVAEILQEELLHLQQPTNVSPPRRWRKPHRSRRTGRPYRVATLIIGVFFICATLLLVQQHQPRMVSPFTGVEYGETDTVKVEYEGKWYELVSLEGKKTDEIFEHCQKTYKSLWQKRFAEDLPEVMASMGTTVDATVKLELRDPATQEILTVDKAVMTRANRQRIYSKRNKRILELLAQAEKRSHATLSPFTEVLHPDKDIVHVEYKNDWYQLIAIENKPTVEILDFCREEFFDNWQKRFDEDLVEVFAKMDSPLGKTVRLKLRHLESGKETDVAAAEMTSSNRQSVYKRRRQRERPDNSGLPPATPENLEASFERFKNALRYQWSYFRATNAVEEKLSALEKRIRSTEQPPLNANQFALELHKIIAAGIDGHASVGGFELPGKGFLPFLIEPVGDRFVAFVPSRERFLAEDVPFISHIDGKPISDWLTVIQPYVVQGSPQYKLRHQLRWIRSLDFFREQLGLPIKETVSVQLYSSSGEAKTVSLDVLLSPPAYRTWPRTESKTLRDNIGYLRIEKMDEDAVSMIEEWIPKWKQTSGIIVDVRDNGGGSRAALRRLAGFLIGPDEAPVVVNASKYRLFEKFGEYHLENRYCYTADSSVWRESEQQTINAFVEQFQTRWEPPAEELSAWHYMVLNRSQRPNDFHYDRPVIVLTNAKCFSATDIFVAGMKELDDVTIAGTSTGGGSARTQSAEIADGINIRVGSMVSYQPNGELFDGNGVTPDVKIQPKPTDFIGESDELLTWAVNRIKNGAKD
ncbi:MAG: protein kinase [Planctomycetota bacterium]